MIDRIGVTRYPVRVAMPQAMTKTKFLGRLATMEHEVIHLLTAIKDMRTGINSGKIDLLTGGMMNSRNWTLSAVMSHCYLQVLAFDDTGPAGSGFPGQLSPLPVAQAVTLYNRAAVAGAEDGQQDR